MLKAGIRRAKADVPLIESRIQRRPVVPGVAAVRLEHGLCPLGEAPRGQPRGSHGDLDGPLE